MTFDKTKLFHVWVRNSLYIIGKKSNSVTHQYVDSIISLYVIESNNVFSQKGENISIRAVHLDRTHSFDSFEEASEFLALELL